MQLRTLTFRTDPDISLPMTTPPWPCANVQLLTKIFSHGIATRLPSALYPDLITMQSSPTSKWQLLMRTFRQESGSIASVFAESEGAIIVRLSSVTFSQ